MTKKLKTKVSPKELTIDEMLEIAAEREAIKLNAAQRILALEDIHQAILYK